MTELQSTVSSVTVYPDRARVTRRGAATLEPGNHRLEISELPLKLDAASVRASARGTARARLLAVDTRRDFYVETPAERVRELEKQVESLQDEIRELDAQTELLEREEAVLGELASQTETYARGLAYGKIDAETQMALLDGLRTRTQELNSALLDLAVRRREADRRLSKLENELSQLRGARRRERYTAVVEVDVIEAGDLTVELTYVVPGAGWQPLYDMRLLEEGEQPVLEVGYLAQVTQQTGEDWSDVAFTLSLPGLLWLRHFPNSIPGTSGRSSLPNPDLSEAKRGWPPPLLLRRWSRRWPVSVPTLRWLKRMRSRRRR